MASRVDLPPMGRFDPHSDSASLATRWEQWLKRFNIYLRAGKITDKTQQRALLLYMAGPEVQTIFETLTDTGNDDDFKTAVEKLSEYFMPKKNIEYEIYTFRQARQSADETLDQYHTRLRKLATTCEFADADREIKMQIIQSCASSRLRKKALRDSTLTLNALLAEGRSIEVTERQAAGIEKSLATIKLDEPGPSETDDSLNAIRSQPRRQSLPREEKPKRKCYYCGLDYPHKTNGCPAEGKECSLCHKMNHFARVCKSSQNRDRARQNQAKFRQQRPRFHDINNPAISNLNYIHSGARVESNSSSEDEYIYTAKTYPRNTSKTNLTVKLKINRTNLRALVDTGASINIIDETTFQNLCKQKPIQLRRSKARVYTYASQAPLPMMGVFEEIVESKNKMTTAKFHVAKGNGGNLLCPETATELDLITLNVNNVNTAKPEVRTCTGIQNKNTSGQQNNTNTSSH